MENYATETENGPLGQSYITCIDCGNNSRVTVKESQDVDLDDYWCRECEEMHEPGDYYDDDRDIDFADPGGRSALRAETPDNPRNLPCRSCGRENMLTPADRELGYQCDFCADQAEMGF